MQPTQLSQPIQSTQPVQPALSNPPFSDREQLSGENALINLATSLRIDVIKMLAQAGSGHPASALGLADFFAFFYQYILRHNPHQPEDPDRDRFFLSAGHICPILYATLAEFGYFSIDQLATLRQLNSPFQGHPHRDLKLGIENSSGPLGQGVSMAVGCAYDLQLRQSPARVYSLCSDGEQQEGQVWETYQFAAQYDLSNFTLIIDVNDIQISGRTTQVMNQRDLGQKLSAFGFQIYRVNGHSFLDLAKTFKLIQVALDSQTLKTPQAIILDTIPGKGVSFMENDYRWHGKAPNQQEATQAIQELETNLIVNNYDQ